MDPMGGGPKSRFSLEKRLFLCQDDLPSFLYRRTPVASAAASSDDFVLNKETCQHGKFLLNDPRVGAFAGRKNPHMAGARKNHKLFLYIYISYIYICILYFCLITQLHLPKVQVSIAMLAYQRIICDERIHTCAALVVRWRASYQEAPFERGAHFEGREIDAKNAFTWSWYVLIHPRCLRMWPLFPCSRCTYRLIKLEKNRDDVTRLNSRWNMFRNNVPLKQQSRDN